jgi:hypothetical protein
MYSARPKLLRKGSLIYDLRIAFSSVWVNLVSNLTDFLSFDF